MCSSQRELFPRHVRKFLSKPGKNQTRFVARILQTPTLYNSTTGKTRGENVSIEHAWTIAYGGDIKCVRDINCVTERDKGLSPIQLCLSVSPTQQPITRLRCQSANSS